MKTKEFNKNFEIDRKRNGIVANEKSKLPSRKKKREIWTIANGDPYIHGTEYYFFDEQIRKVRSSRGLSFDEGNLMSFGFRVIEVEKLHTHKDKAIGDAQKFFLARMKNLRKEVEVLEKEKSPENRSLKNILMARDI